MKIQVEIEPDDVVIPSLLQYLRDSYELTKKDKKALKRVLAHYMPEKDYDEKFGKGEWQEMMKDYL
jgi:hypothetical protein